MRPSSLAMFLVIQIASFSLLFLLQLPLSLQESAPQPVSTYQLMFDECPSPEKLQPCTCLPESRQIICNSSITNPNDIRYIFAEASNSKQLKFAHLIFANSPLEKLVSRSFNNFHFLALTIQNHYYLSIFEENAFWPANDNANTLKFDGNPKLGYTNESVYSLFAAVQTFSRMSTLVIHHCGLTFIPPNAFGSADSPRLQYLRRVSLLGNSIKTIFSTAFNSLPNIRNINLANNQVERIEDGAIKLTTEQCSELYTYEKIYYSIDLSNNKLTPTSLNSTSIRFDCSTDLNLSNNTLYYLPQSTFRPLFGQFVKIQLLGNHLDCSACQMAWLLKGRYCPAYNSTIHYHSLVESVCDASTLSLASFKLKCATYLQKSTSATPTTTQSEVSTIPSSSSADGKHHFNDEALVYESEADLLQCPSEGPNSSAFSSPLLTPFSLPIAVMLLNLSAFLVTLMSR